MSWIVSYSRRADRSHLGDRQAIEEAIASVFPGVQFYCDPSGPERIAVMRERGVEFPDVIRRHLEQLPATRQGDFVGDGFSARFFLEAEPQSEPQLDKLTVELRGETERAVAFLRQLAARIGWELDEGTW